VVVPVTVYTVDLDDALAQFHRDMVTAHAPRTVTCTDCGATPGNFCRSDAGNNVPTHDVRKAAAELLDDPSAAVEAMRHRQYEARMKPLPALSADQQETREATSQAWDAVVDLTAERLARRGRLPQPPSRQYVCPRCHQVSRGLLAGCTDPICAAEQFQAEFALERRIEAASDE
jgi:hypothetical protein